MSGGYCSECGAYALTLAYHRCPPAWQVRDADDCDDDDIVTIKAHEADEAAEKYAKQSDSDGGEGPNERTVLVRKAGEEWQRFKITFDYSIDYYANEEK
jgi:hypothetical protein